MNVPVNRKTSLYIVGRDADTCARFETWKRSFVNLAFSKKSRFRRQGRESPRTQFPQWFLTQLFICLWKIWLTEKKKSSVLTKEQERLTKEIARCQGMLNNPNFVNKAPAAKVDAEKEKLQKYEEMMEKVNVQLSQMQK